MSVSCRDSFSGYGGSWPFPPSVGGIVACGLRLVRAKMRALATLSAYVLNSAPGVICLIHSQYSCTMHTGSLRIETFNIQTPASTYVARCIDSTAHDHHLLDPQKRLRIFCGGERKVSQWSYSHNRNRVRLVLPQQLEHLLVRWLQRGREQRVLVLYTPQRLCLLCRQILRHRQEEGLPCFRGRQVRVLKSG